MASATATAFSEIATLPICTLKTNYQNSGSTSIMGTARNLWKTGGISSFYGASFPAIASQVVSMSCKYVLYEYFKTSSMATNRKGNVANIASGMVAGLISTLLTHPLDACKIHLQMMSRSSTKDGAWAHFRKHPVLLYRGYSKTIGKILVTSACFMPIYDFLLLHIETPMFASMISAIISTTLAHPLDYLKTRHTYGLSIWHGWNPRTYYKGLSINLLRVVPHFTITMSLISFLKKI
jgi:Mitochondrial carrier protein